MDGWPRFASSSSQNDDDGARSERERGRGESFRVGDDDVIMSFAFPPSRRVMGGSKKQSMQRCAVINMLGSM